ncbi:hypothetical protein FDG62_gp057 [Mycobacterium phage Nepal]|uniref:Uncharacterized protein n=1 Tax=Mycobacterium phage Nepal TaxID=2927981 RepID=I3WUC8_9CAUD|nr:hypothetical protein FDG62_gp057 [Mycobacterium phage Nepal]AFL46599.1 hypothetical protein NEPAL_57 [Mycobacterium phage Nepal]
MPLPLSRGVEALGRSLVHFERFQVLELLRKGKCHHIAHGNRGGELSNSSRKSTRAISFRRRSVITKHWLGPRPRSIWQPAG